MNDPTRPYNDLPTLPPAVELESKTVLKRCITARAEVAQLRAAGQLVPDPQILVNMIPLLEAKASSEIENIVTTNDALFREASAPDASSDPAAKEALRYRGALYTGLGSLAKRPITTATAIEICREIKAVEIDVRRVPGITLRNSQTGKVIYTPPEGAERLRSLLANWEQFVNATDDLDPLVRLAVQHYQFEAIHPFIDGNGRTGRILNVLILIQSGLLDLPTLYMSRNILRTRTEYYRLLGRVTTHGEWESWIVYMLDAMTDSCRWTNQKIGAIRALMDAAGNHIRSQAPKLYSRELVELLFRQTYHRIADVVDAGLAKRQTASTYLQELVRIGVLEDRKVGREKLFLHRRYIDLLSSEDHTFRAYGQ
ncbi:MAG: Fic family protein [Hyphomicrobiales bacterium]|nr:Fic family protein [Hyphomicrobiales bacterium]